LKLIAGLGNPGLRYAQTRHNIGWMVVDSLVEKLGAGRFRSRFQGLLWGPWNSACGELALLKPTTFMNLSLKSVRAAVNVIGVDPADVLIVYDDIHLPLGRLRFRPKGSAGGHNGMSSVIGALETDQIARLRVGVGAPSSGADQIDWVLGEFEAPEMDVLARVLEGSLEAIRLWILEGAQKTASTVNGRDFGL
jgi:PTH1 family peptidyl-tRNA hydrolase